MNNTIQAIDTVFNNVWDNRTTKKGNHWSDYNGTDSNTDGIGDEPYYIQPNGIDRYPQMPSNPPDDDGGGGGGGGCYIDTLRY